MAYQLTDINFRTISDPKEFVEECDARYEGEVKAAAEMILENRGKSPIILLSGPSGSGKTTTAMKISDEHPATAPRTPEGDIDLESPLCLDMELLNKHFTMLSRGERIYVPKYEFSRQMRIQEPSKSIKLKKDEMVVFEGIHALNDMITVRHPEAFKLYISARSDVVFNGSIIFKRTWFRLVRRMVRDYNFRGSDPAMTMSMWANVRRGELSNISPFKSKADLRFDTSHAYEPALFNATATKLFASVPEGIERYEELRQVLPALQLFGHIDESLIAPDALVREFIGGGIYEYCVLSREF